MKKVVHFFWGLEKKMPFFNFLSIKTFKDLHPEWRINLYLSTTSKFSPTWLTNEQNFSYSGEDYTKQAEMLSDNVIYFDYEKIGFSNHLHSVHKADILRQYLMYANGGLWSDMDVIWLQPVETIGLQGIDITLNVHEWHSSGIMYSVGENNSFYKNILLHLKQHFDSLSYQSAGPDILNRLYPSFSVACDMHKDLNFLNVEYNKFYPYKPDEIHNLYTKGGQDNIDKSTVCVHWFGGSPKSVPAIQQMTNKNIDIFEGAPIYKCLRAALGSTND